MTKEETIFARHLIDLSRQADQRGIITYSDFLNLNEQNIFYTCIPELYTSYEMYGGYDTSERQMIAFLPEALMFPPKYPLVCCKIEPLQRKFADAVNHRDVLGSLMSLGIDRNKIGDILIKEQEIYVFCHRNIFDLLKDELTRIRHTSVRIQEAAEGAGEISPNLEHCTCIVSSNRLDSLLAAMCRISRSEAAGLIKQGRVFINGREMSSNSYICKEQEIISVRGIGRFRYIQAYGETRKGRTKVEYSRYV